MNGVVTNIIKNQCSINAATVKGINHVPYKVSSTVQKMFQSMIFYGCTNEIGDCNNQRKESRCWGKKIGSSQNGKVCLKIPIKFGTQAV
jgi:hypothetical protein